MSATQRTFRGEALLLAVTLTACSSPNVCTDVRDALRRCGFPVTRVDCNQLTITDLQAIASRTDVAGCQGFASDDARSVDARVCLLGGFPCPESPTPAPTRFDTKYPLVFVSGIDGTALFDWHPDILRATGGHHVKVLPWATTPERAQDLWQSLQSLAQGLHAEKLNLICYAVGGIDCRYLVADGGLFAHEPAALERARRLVASITTIATPHRGTRVADAAIDAVQSGTARDVLEAWTGADVSVPVPDDAALARTLRGLTPEALDALNATLTDPPGLLIQSFAGISHVAGRSSASTDAAVEALCRGPDGQSAYQHWPDTRDAMNEALWATAPFSNATLGEGGRKTSSPSDGMVSVKSAAWGVFRGCIPADHYDVIGQIGHTTRDPMTGFDAPQFYQWLAAGLASVGL